MKRKLDDIFMTSLKELKESKEGKKIAKMKDKRLQLFLAELYEWLSYRLAEGKWQEKKFISPLDVIAEKFKTIAEEKVKKLEEEISSQPIESEDLLDETPPHIEELNRMIEHGIYAVQEMSIQEGESPEKEKVKSSLLSSLEAVEEPPDFKKAFEAQPPEVKEFFGTHERYNWLVREFQIYKGINTHFKLKELGLEAEAESYKSYVLELIKKHFKKVDLEKKFNEYVEKINNLKKYLAKKNLTLTDTNLIAYLYEIAKETLPKEITSEDIQRTVSEKNLHDIISKALSTLKGTPLEETNFFIVIERGLKPVAIRGELPAKTMTLTTNLIVLYPVVDDLLPISRYFRWIYTFEGASVEFARLWWLLTRYDPVMNLYTYIPPEIGEKLGIRHSGHVSGALRHANWFFEITTYPLSFLSFESLKLTVKSSDEAVEKIKNALGVAEGIPFVLLNPKLFSKTIDNTLLLETHTQPEVLNLLNGKFYNIYKAGITEDFKKLFEDLKNLGIDEVEITIPSGDKIVKYRVSEIISTALSEEILDTSAAELLYRLQRLVLPPYKVYEKILKILSNKLPPKYIPELKSMSDILFKAMDDYFKRGVSFYDLEFPNFWDYINKLEEPLKTELLTEFRKIFVTNLKSIDEDITYLSDRIDLRNILAILFIASKIGVSAKEITSEYRSEIGSTLSKLFEDADKRYLKLKEKYGDDFVMFFDYRAFPQMVIHSTSLYILGDRLVLKPSYKAEKTFEVPLKTVSLSSFEEFDFEDPFEIFRKREIYRKLLETFMD